MGRYPRSGPSEIGVTGDSSAWDFRGRAAYFVGRTGLVSHDQGGVGFLEWRDGKLTGPMIARISSLQGGALGQNLLLEKYYDSVNSPAAARARLFLNTPALGALPTDTDVTATATSPAGVTKTAKVIGSDGTSSFLQLASATMSARVSWGRVASNATIALDGSQDWTVSTSGVGIYTITFTPSFAGQTPIGLAIQIGSVFVGATDLGASSASTLQFRFFTSAGAPVNADFAFFALGRN